MKKVNLFCGISSLGMPNTVDNKDNYGYFNYVRDYLEGAGHEIPYAINFSSLDHNYTWNLEKTFKENYYLYHIRNIQNKSIDNLRNTNFLFKLVVPKKYQEKLKNMNSKERIGDIYRASDNPIFLYSSGINDMFAFMKAGPVELLDKNKRRTIGDKLDMYIEQSISNVRGNLCFLKEMNPTVQIYVLGVYNAPILKLFDLIYKVQDFRIRDNPLPLNLLLYVEESFNMYLEQLCSEFQNVHFIDLVSLGFSCAKLDFHPSREGNIVIGEKIVEEILKNTKSSNRVEKSK